VELNFQAKFQCASELRLQEHAFPPFLKLYQTFVVSHLLIKIELETFSVKIDPKFFLIYLLTTASVVVCLRLSEESVKRLIMLNLEYRSGPLS